MGSYFQHDILLVNVCLYNTYSTHPAKGWLIGPPPLMQHKNKKNVYISFNIFFLDCQKIVLFYKLCCSRKDSEFSVWVPPFCLSPLSETTLYSQYSVQYHFCHWVQRYSFHFVWICLFFNYFCCWLQSEGVDYRWSLSPQNAKFFPPRQQISFIFSQDWDHHKFLDGRPPDIKEYADRR